MSFSVSSVFPPIDLDPNAENGTPFVFRSFFFSQAAFSVLTFFHFTVDASLPPVRHYTCFRVKILLHQTPTLSPYSPGFTDAATTQKGWFQQKLFLCFTPQYQQVLTCWLTLPPEFDSSRFRCPSPEKSTLTTPVQHTSSFCSYSKSHCGERNSLYYPISPLFYGL